MAIALAYSLPQQVEGLNELIAGCARNERGAQERMYRLFYPKMMYVVKRYIDHIEQAEEVLNNGFLRAFKKINLYNYQGSFEGWLRKIVFHAVADYVKSNAKYSDKVLLIEKDELIAENCVEKLQYNQLLDIVNTLPEATKAVFNMYVIEGYSHKEIGKMLNISEGTSKWHLFEGRKYLKNKIEKLDLHYK